VRRHVAVHHGLGMAVFFVLVHVFWRGHGKHPHQNAQDERGDSRHRHKTMVWRAGTEGKSPDPREGGPSHRDDALGEPQLDRPIDGHLAKGSDEGRL
jgi:hypothetical protein